MATITGASGPDTLLGTSGNDTITGGGGNDRLEGRGGNDTLNGGTGIDRLFGGAGNDIYLIDNASEIIKTEADTGVDLVKSTVTYTLGANQEHLTLLGTSALNGTGNTGANTITGNSGANQLKGLGGNDLLKGGGGNDTLTGGANSDNLQGGAGNDTLIFDAADLANVDGGTGTDTLKVQGANMTANLVTLNATTQVFKGIEVINLAATGAQTVVLDEATVLALSGTDTILVRGTAADAVDTQGVWSDNGPGSAGGIPYTEYVSGAATLRVQSGVDVSGIEPVVNLNLSSLNGTNGFEINGETAEDFSGNSVSSAGDVNGDGYDDLLIGASLRDTNGGAAGATYVVFGRGTGFSANLNLSALNGSNGFEINGETANDLSGRSVSAAGDVNGDGYDDLLIGAPLRDTNGGAAGATYVVFGSNTGFSANLNLSALNGSNGFEINGETANDLSGRSVSAAGDVNGDGFDDLLIGAYRRETNGGAAGASYVVFGSGMGFASNLDLSALNGTNGFEISGETAGDVSGRSVSSAGDVNGDGFDDVLIGAWGRDTNGGAAGASYVVFGSGMGFASNLDLSALNGTNGFEISGETAGDYSGYSVSAAGDVNGDGFDDLLIGADGRDTNPYTDAGASYVVFGSGAGFASNLDLSALNGTNGFEINGETAVGHSGFSVSSAGDVNGDGFDDLLIGAPGGGTSAGASYVVFGGSTGFSSNLNLSALNGMNGFEINGETTNDYSGWSVSAAGDVNGDGFDDLLIGADSRDTNGSAAGASYVVFGRDFRDEIVNANEGSAGNDTLTGTAADEILIGGLGNDTLSGLGGDDMLTGGAGIDTITGGAGNDRLNGGTGDDSMNGTAGNDWLSGDAGADTLDGGTGNDVMTGGTGNDVFLFNDALGTSNVDTIMDFGGAGATALDVIRLENSIFTALTTLGGLSADNIVASAGGPAIDTDDFIIYNTSTGELFYDPDGSGTGSSATKFAVIANDADELSAADFVVI